jgi:hypothetical protein
VLWLRCYRVVWGGGRVRFWMFLLVKISGWLGFSLLKMCTSGLEGGV